MAQQYRDDIDIEKVLSARARLYIYKPSYLFCHYEYIRAYIVMCTLYKMGKGSKEGEHGRRENRQKGRACGVCAACSMRSLPCRDMDLTLMRRSPTTLLYTQLRLHSLPNTLCLKRYIQRVHSTTMQTHLYFAEIQVVLRFSFRFARIYRRMYMLLRVREREKDDVRTRIHSLHYVQLYRDQLIADDHPLFPPTNPSLYILSHFCGCAAML